MSPHAVALQGADRLGAPAAADVDHDRAVVAPGPHHHGGDVTTLPARNAGFCA
jgi:hypothetical protein